MGALYLPHLGLLGQLLTDLQLTLFMNGSSHRPIGKLPGVLFYGQLHGYSQGNTSHPW